MDPMEHVLPRKLNLSFNSYNPLFFFLLLIEQSKIDPFHKSNNIVQYISMEDIWLTNDAFYLSESETEFSLVCNKH